MGFIEIVSLLSCHDPYCTLLFMSFKCHLDASKIEFCLKFRFERFAGFFANVFIYTGKTLFKKLHFFDGMRFDLQFR